MTKVELKEDVHIASAERALGVVGGRGRGGEQERGRGRGRRGSG
jgi:hypothetical protein